jgi:primase-polymerase (primpol)-like protein
MTDAAPHNGNGSAPPVAIPAVLQSYANQERWVVWKYEVRDGKRTNPPFQARDPSRYARNDDPSTWAPAAEALGTYHQHKDRFEGIGIELRDSNLVAFDLDSCIGPTGILHSLARRIVDQAQSYTEITPSNTGLRIIGTGTGPRIHRHSKASTATSVASATARQRASSPSPVASSKTRRRFSPISMR